MPIDSLHPNYKASMLKWERCRDAYEGSDAIKEKGQKYLPKLQKQTKSEYNAYKDRALFYSITSKTVGALLGMAMVRPPVVRMPEEMKWAYQDDKGVQFLEYLSVALSENLLMGRIGVLIDRPAPNEHPQPVFYPTESIINWSFNGDGKLMWVVLKEVIDVVKKDDRYDMTTEVQYRLLEINSLGQYQSIVYNEKGDPKSAPVVPVNGGVAMDFIPFFVANPQGLGMEIHKPPVLDIVDINISHYRSSADLEHGRHFTALPTPYITGVSGSEQLHIGSTAAWGIPDPNAKVGFLEFTGQGLQSLEKALSEKQNQLASLSARLLDNSTRGSESPETIRLRYSSESASLSSVVRACEALLIQCYRTIAMMDGVDFAEGNITLNKEFMDSKLTPTQVIDLIQAYFDGGIDAITLVHNLRRGDIIPVYIDDAVAIAEVEKNKEAHLKREEEKTARRNNPPKQPPAKE